MTQLVWTVANGSELSSTANGVSILVARTPGGHGYRYRLVGRAGALASGHRDELRDAIVAAERAAHVFAMPVPLAG